MCLITFAYNQHPKYSLILAGNRDEFYERPARPATFWSAEDDPGLLAGKDMQAGGTWLGAHKDGRWAALTNYRDPSDKKEDPPSRGQLVLDYLSSDHKAMEYLSIMNPEASLYNGFNLLLWDDQDFVHYSNKSKKFTQITPGVHGLSNALLDTPWPKLDHANHQLKQLIQEEEVDKEKLFQLLMNEEKAEDEDLPVTGIPKDLERAVSSIFIRTDHYGTRCSTLLLIDRAGNVDFTERTYRPGTKEVKGEVHQSFKID